MLKNKKEIVPHFKKNIDAQLNLVFELLYWMYQDDVKSLKRLSLFAIILIILMAHSNSDFFLGIFT